MSTQCLKIRYQADVIPLGIDLDSGNAELHEAISHLENAIILYRRYAESLTRYTEHSERMLNFVDNLNNIKTDMECTGIDIEDERSTG
jgi:hypothetical protein